MIQSSKAIKLGTCLRYPNNCISLFWNRVFNSKVEGSLILNNLTFDISKGTCLGVLGTNGAGKSTLLQLLTGILTPTMGKVEINSKVQQF